MLREIFRFEVRYHLKAPLFYICAAFFFLMAFGAVTSDAVQIGGSIGNVHRNAPFVIMQLLVLMSIIFGIFTTTAFVSNAALRDFDLGTDSLFFSSPIKKRDYLIGRFAGSLFVSFLVFLAIAVAIMIGVKMPWIDSEFVGAFTFTPYAFSLFVLVLPTLLVIGAISFAIAALTRSTMATYSGSVLLFVGYLVASILTRGMKYEKIGSLFDPFAGRSFGLATRYWTAFERNTKVLPLEGIFLWNRILWIAIALVVFVATLVLFRADGRRAGSGAKKKKGAYAEDAAPIALRLPVVSQHFDAPAWLRQFASTVRLELSAVVKSIPFIVILLLALVNVFLGAWFGDSLFDTKIYPVTGQMLRAISDNFLFFAYILMTFYAGEIVFRERQLKINEVTDSMPVASSAVWGGKLAAVVTTLVLLLSAGVFATLSVQTFKGFHHYEPSVYLRGVFLNFGTSALLFATFAFVAQILTNNKYAGFLTMLVLIILAPILNALHLEHNLYIIGNVPDSQYSDMNGYGHFARPAFWFTLYWGLFAAMLVVAGHLLWVRGTESAFGRRLAIARGRFGKPAIAALVLLFAGFASTGCYIYYNTNMLNRYRTSDVREKRQAEYEKKFKKYAGLAQPRITDVQADVDLYPERRGATIRGSYRLLNWTKTPISELHISTNPDVKSMTVSIPGTTVKSSDKTFGYTIYKLDPPLQPGATLPMTYAVDMENPGFVNANSNTELVYNGTFFNNFTAFPHIGYLRYSELQDRSKRKKYGLPPVERYPSIDDPKGHMINQLTGESDWLNFDTTVSTSADQIALAPGYLQKEWTANGRRYFHYKTTTPILGFWSYLSARYTVKRDHWRDVNIEIYYDAKHPYNVDRMIYAVKKSLDYYTANFSPYQHKQVRILEFPRYARFAQSFPNTIPFSESIGFIADLRNKDDIDYVFYVTAHEVGHQWWAHQVVGAQVQGTTMITETMAQYSALMVMEKEYGREQMRKFLKFELNRYLRGRGNELVKEQPLMYVEDQPYVHYAKGSLSMYALRDAIGEERLNSAIRSFIRKYAFHGPPYPTTRDFLAEVRAVTPPDQQSLITDLFETITLYDNKAVDAKSTKLPDGRYRVDFTVEAKKMRADGKGAETTIGLNDWIDVGVLADKPHSKEDAVLAIERHRITKPHETFSIIVKEKPSKAGIDPLNKLVDRNPEDNVKDVS